MDLNIFRVYQNPLKKVVNATLAQLKYKPTIKIQFWFLVSIKLANFAQAYKYLLTYHFAVN